jgi:hypothetical protein
MTSRLSPVGFAMAIRRLAIASQPASRMCTITRPRLMSSGSSAYGTQLRPSRPSRTWFRACLIGGVSLSIALVGVFHGSPAASETQSPVDSTKDVESRTVPNFTAAIQALQEEFPDHGVVSTDPNELFAYAQSSYSQVPGRFCLQRELPAV